MSRLRAQAVLDNRHFYDVSYEELIRMLNHYGFVRVNDVSGHAAHLVFKHRDYADVIPPITVPKGKGTIRPSYVEKTAEACMRVKELNAIRRRVAAELPEAPPEWLRMSIPVGFVCELDGDNRLHITHQVNGSSARSYTITNLSGKLQILSKEFESADLGFTFHIHKGDRKPAQNFRKQFEELDTVVRALIAEGCAPKLQVTQVATHEKKDCARGLG